MKSAGSWSGGGRAQEALDYRQQSPMPMTWRPKGGPTLVAFKEFHLSDGSVIGVFQGGRGKNPDLDIVVKYRDSFTKTSAPRTPKHIHWVIDLLLKKENSRTLTLEFIDYLLAIYDRITPFCSKADQRSCALIFSTSNELQRFATLNQFGQYSVEFLAHVMELLSIEEKTGFDGAFMFKGVLQALRQEKDIFSIVSAATHAG